MLRTSKNCEIILEIIKNSREPISAENIFLELKNQGKSVSLSTIYRALDTLTSRDIITKTHLLTDNTARYTLNKANHDHYFVCLECNKLINIGSCQLKTFMNSLQENNDFEITGHKFELYGYCAECK